MPETAYAPDPRRVPLTTPASRGFGSIREQVLTARTYYVKASGGSDTFDGLSQGGAFATLSRAIDEIHTLDIAANVNVVIQLMDGNHTIASQITMRNFSGIGQVVIQGNLADKTKVTLTAPAGSGAIMLNWIGTGGSRWFLQSLTLVGTTASIAINLSSFARITVSNLRFGANFANCFVAANCSFLQLIGNSYEFFGSVTNAVFLVQRQAQVLWTTTATATITGTPAFAVFVSCVDMGYARISVASITFSGSATGNRYGATGLSLIQTNGGGANFFPGDQAGSVGDQSQYL